MPENRRGGRCAEEEPVHRRADHPCHQRARERDQGRRRRETDGRDRDDVLPLEVEVRRHGRERREAAQAARGRKLSPEAAAGGPAARQRSAESGALKKMVRPAAFRAAVGFVQAEFKFSIRRSCRALGFARSSMTYESKRATPVELLEKLK